MSFVNCNKFNTSQALQDQAIADLAQELLTKQNALKDCSGNPLAGNVPTCAQMTTAIQNAIDALPADKFLKGLKSYNPATNTMTLLMSDGSTVDIDMTDLLADAVSGGAAPTGAAGGDLQGTYPNPTVNPAVVTNAVTNNLTTQAAVAGVFNNCAGTPLTPRSRLLECSAKGTDIPYLVNGVIPANQLPSFVDDVLEFPALASFPATGEAGKIYIDASTGKTYRWNGAGYTEISTSAGVTVQDEGSVLTTAATSINFVGTGVTATSSGGAVTATIDAPVAATDTQAGLVELATSAETIAGTSTELAVTPAGLKAAIDAAPNSDAQTLSVNSSGISISNGNTIDAISNDSGNLLQWRSDGAYYGTTAEDDVESLYINVNGDNSAAGTEAAPLKDAWAALERGAPGTTRRLFFAEGQTHYVDPEHIARYRGGEFIVSIYGPQFDALPEVVGDHKAMQAAAKALGTKIKSRPAAIRNGYQENAALIPTMGAKVIYIGFAELSPAGDNGSGAPRSRNQGTFGSYTQNGSVVLRNTNVHLVGASYGFDAYAIANFSLTVEKNVVVTGSGKLITPDVSRNFTLNVVENQAAIVPFLPPLTTATRVVTAINTNLDANLLP